MMRRFQDDGAQTGAPDSAHLHHVVYRNWAHGVAKFIHVPTFANPVTSLIMWALPVVTLGSVWLCGLTSQNSMWFIGLIVVFYVASYRGIIASENSVQKD